ncbi:hypothetical protein [Cytobacillus solani]|uniref:Uncharacterized protein n=1 Tax=Cytobacillus solani TaxID=1637975 RepID=A0A0Q3QLB9_9BACI|nr:hypothetical protein [Cytobacillus solani]KOP81547.1 hypothetical protein AMS60_03070 [Bacillus sp. FJAT-21945]KQL18486.1 hypothetical protein AN957_07835 [Cytobacillus solani]
MRLSGEGLNNFYGVSPRARHKKGVDSMEHLFRNPIIHRQIHGDTVYVPLNIDRIWNQIS